MNRTLVLTFVLIGLVGCASSSSPDEFTSGGISSRLTSSYRNVEADELTASPEFTRAAAVRAEFEIMDPTDRLAAAEEILVDHSIASLPPTVVEDDSCPNGYGTGEWFRLTPNLGLFWGVMLDNAGGIAGLHVGVWGGGRIEMAVYAGDGTPVGYGTGVYGDGHFYIHLYNEFGNEGEFWGVIGPNVYAGRWALHCDPGVGECDPADETSCGEGYWCNPCPSACAPQPPSCGHGQTPGHPGDGESDDTADNLDGTETDGTEPTDIGEDPCGDGTETDATEPVEDGDDSCITVCDAPRCEPRSEPEPLPEPCPIFVTDPCPQLCNGELDLPTACVAEIACICPTN